MKPVPKSNRLLLAVVSIGLPVGRSLATEGPVDRAKPVAHTARDIEGWTVQVDHRLLCGPDAPLGGAAVRLLSDRLYELKLVVPEDKVKRLQEVPLWLDLTHGKLNSMQYHPSRAWLKEHGYSERLVRCVHIPDARQFASPRHHHQQPWAVLHELAHAYHDQSLGFEHGEIEAAWERFKAKGRYQSVLDIGGNTRAHYALTNPREFFAEMTEAYFGTNDFFPFSGMTCLAFRQGATSIGSYAYTRFDTAKVPALDLSAAEARVIVSASFIDVQESKATAGDDCPWKSGLPLVGLVAKMKDWLAASTMPAMVHDILLKHGKIETPWLPGRAEKCRWVAEQDWLYAVRFPAADPKAESCLRFMGLDTIVDVYLNGKRIASHSNMYVPLVVDVTGLLRPENTLLLHFHTAFDLSGKEPKPRRTVDGDGTQRVRRPGQNYGSYLGPNPLFSRVGVYDRVFLEVTRGSAMTEVNCPPAPSIPTFLQAESGS